MGPPPPAAALEGGGLRSSAIPPQSVRSSAARSTSSVSSGHSHRSRDSQVGAGASNLMQMAQGGQNLPTIPLKSGPGSASSHALSNPSDWANSPASSAAQCRASQCGSVCNGGSAAHDACSGPQRLADGAQRSSQRGSAAAAEGRPHQAQASSDDPRRRPPVQGRSPGSPSKGSTSHLRTVSAALQRLNGLPPDLPVDFPSGPFASIQMHMDQIKAWCTNPLTGGGIFQIREKEFKDAGKKRGAIARLVCNHEGKPRRQSSASAGVMHASADGDDGDDDVPPLDDDDVEVDDLLDVEEGHVVGTTMGTRKRKKKPETESRKRGSWRCGCKWSVNLEVCRGLDGLEQ